MIGPSLIRSRNGFFMSIQSKKNLVFRDTRRRDYYTQMRKFFQTNELPGASFPSLSAVLTWFRPGRWVSNLRRYLNSVMSESKQNIKPQRYAKGAQRDAESICPSRTLRVFSSATFALMASSHDITWVPGGQHDSNSGTTSCPASLQQLCHFLLERLV